MNISLPLILVTLLIASLIPYSSTTAPVTYSSEEKPVYVAFIWHYHQPWYYSVNGSYFILPWVRMHTVGNYYKMAYILSKYSGIKVTFDFSGSLVSQVLAYEKGVMDYRQIISLMIANGRNLTLDEKFSMLQIPGGFFDINWNRIVNVVPRFRVLRDEAQAAFNKYGNLPQKELKEKVVAQFTNQDFLDLATLFNLYWMDPEVLHDFYPNLYQLWVKGFETPGMHFTREELKKVLQAHNDLIEKLLPIYKELASKGQAEIIPVPYSHPLAPIIADFGWIDDLDLHINKSLQLFKEVFNITPAGIWPAEEAINEYVVKEFSKYFVWTVSDETVLAKSGIDISNPANTLKPWYIDFNGKRIYILFRNTELSNLISFSYSSKPTDQAVSDLINRILAAGKTGVKHPLIVVALDGENPWENYIRFGDNFLNKLYSTLQKYQDEGLIKTVTPAEYIKLFENESKELPLKPHKYLDLKGKDISNMPISYSQDAYNELPRKTVYARIAEGSWASGVLTMWIGQRQENAAWMLLAKARHDLLKALNTSSILKAYKERPKAVENLLRAEASDWFWWYGGDAGGGFPANPLFKAYLRNVYTYTGIQPPAYLLTNFNPEGTPVGTVNTEPPPPLKTPPDIDGYLKDSAWSNALNLTLGTKYIKNIKVAVDSNNLYIGINPWNEGVLKSSITRVGIYLTNPWRSVSPYNLQYNPFPRYSKVDLGMGLFYEILVLPSNSSAYVSVAEGKGGWFRLFKVSNIKVGKAVELAVPWSYLSLRPGDTVYLTAVTYVNNSIPEVATKLGKTYFLKVPAPTAGPAGKVVFQMNDPVGDDNGLGTYKYPKDKVFQPGVFDLTKFTVINAGSKVVFITRVKNLGDNPWNGPNGFCLQYVQIYIHMPKSKLPENINTYGLNVTIDKKDAWQVALLLAPGWGSDPVPKGQRAALYYSNGSIVVQNKVFKVYADTLNNAIIAEVSKSLLPDVAGIGNWSYTVFLTSYDGYGPDRIRSFGVNAEEWVVGAGKQYASAIVKNDIPRVMDLLAPSAQAQYEMLKTFIIKGSVTKEAVVQAVSNQPVTSLTPKTVVITLTTTATLIRNETKTESITTTLTQTSTLTYTYTYHHTTTCTHTEHHTHTVTITKPSSEAFILGVIGVAIAVILAGLAFVYLAIKRKP